MRMRITQYCAVYMMQTAISDVLTAQTTVFKSNINQWTNQCSICGRCRVTSQSVMIAKDDLNQLPIFAIIKQPSTDKGNISSAENAANGSLRRRCQRITTMNPSSLAPYVAENSNRKSISRITLVHTMNYGHTSATIVQKHIKLLVLELITFAHDTNNKSFSALSATRLSHASSL